MRLYLSSSLKNKDKVIDIANLLLLTNHEITFKWWELDLPQTRPTALKMLTGIRKAEALIFIPPGGRGAHGELTSAIAVGKRTLYLLNKDQKTVPNDCLFYSCCVGVDLDKLPTYLKHLERLSMRVGKLHPTSTHP